MIRTIALRHSLRRFLWLSSLLAFAVLGGVRPNAFADETKPTLELTAKTIFAKGPNKWNGDDLEITRGRGANIGWYVYAERPETVSVWVEYACEKPLNQAYQLSLDGQDLFWDVPVTAPGEFTKVCVGSLSIRAGLPVLLLLVPPSGTTYAHPFQFRKLILEGQTTGNLSWLPELEEPVVPDSSPGFGQKLKRRHPALKIRDLRSDHAPMRVTGMALRDDSELLFTTWEGDLFAVDLDALPPSGPPVYRKLAQGLSEPMGLAIDRGRIFVTEKNQATELIDENGDGRFETYRCMSHDWACTLDYHEYLFGAIVVNDYLYFSASVGMSRRGKDNYQAPLRGSVFRVHLDSGATELVAGGLRTPDGMGLGPEDSILVTDNQGEWLAANKLIRVQQDAFYQFRSRPPWHPLDRPTPTPPTTWLPQGEIAASPTQPIMIPTNWGPYAGQVLIGDAALGGLQRVFLEQIDGVSQGAAFRFSQGFEHLFHRFVFTSDGSLIGGGIARGKDWDFITRVSGLMQIRYTHQPVFEPLAARLRDNGLELEFTEPLESGAGWDPDGYFVSQWGYQSTQTYGGVKVRHRRAEVLSATVSNDRRKVFLEIPSITVNEVLYVRLPESLPSESGRTLWAGDLWYTINRIPSDRPGQVHAPPQESWRASPHAFEFSADNAGRTLYQNLCSACHSLDGSRRIGPSFLGLAGAKREVIDPRTGQQQQVTADEDYLRESITDPNALLVAGYQENQMPPVGGILTERQIVDLLQYLKRVSDKKAAQRELARQPLVIRDWKMDDFASWGTHVAPPMPEPASLLRGQQAFFKAQCVQCHATSGYGTNLAPDLSLSVQKLKGKDLLRRIIEPSSQIHPDYQRIQFLLDDGQVIIGHIVADQKDTLEVVSDLQAPDKRTMIRKANVELQQKTKQSAMPTGLLNVLTKAEILDLMVFLESGMPTVPPVSTKNPTR